MTTFQRILTILTNRTGDGNSAKTVMKQLFEMVTMHKREPEKTVADIFQSNIDWNEFDEIKSAGSDRIERGVMCVHSLPSFLYRAALAGIRAANQHHESKRVKMEAMNTGGYEDLPSFLKTQAGFDEDAGYRPDDIIDDESVMKQLLAEGKLPSPEGVADVLLAFVNPELFSKPKVISFISSKPQAPHPETKQGIVMQLVGEAMYNARENGFDFSNQTVSSIAKNLKAFDADLEEVRLDYIIRALVLLGYPMESKFVLGYPKESK